MSNFPATWVNKKLGVITGKVGSGATPKGGESAYKKHGTPLIRSMNVVFFGFRWEGLAFIDEVQANALANAAVEASDVLLNITGASIGRVTLAPFELHGARVNQHVCIIRPTPTLDARFLAAYLSSPKMQAKIWADNYGVTRQALTKQQILDFDVPVPPLAEQKRIADKLDTLLARVDACRDRLDRIGPLIKRFRQSVLAAATSGRLTEDWRQSRSIASAWHTCATREAGRIQLGRQRSPKYHSGPNMRPYLRVQNVFEDRLDLSDVMAMEFDEGDYERYHLRVGDILLNEGQSPEYLGRPAMYRGELPEACFTNTLIRFQAFDHVDPEFALLVFRHYMHAGRYLKEGTTTTNIAHLGAGRFGSVEFPLPTLEEQKEIARRSSSLFALADRLETRLVKAKTAADRLPPALLAKAFRGELVPQDPNDEPAAELLKRLHGDRVRVAIGTKSPRSQRLPAASRKQDYESTAV